MLRTLSLRLPISPAENRIPKYKSFTNESQHPKGYWDDINNQRKFMNWVSTELNIKDMNDWYNVSHQGLKEKGGASLLLKYNNSPSQLISTVFSEYQWLPWKFRQCSRNYWDDVNNQRKFLDWVAIQLNFHQMSDWYKVTQKEIIDLGGGGLLYRYNNTTLQLLSTVYPEYEWLPWKFLNCSRKYWDDINNQRKFMNWVASQKNIKDFSDWYKVTTKEIIEIGGAGLFHKYNCSLLQLLAAVYPEYEWLPWKFTRLSFTYWEDPKGQQQFMDRIAKQMNIKEMDDWYNISEKDVIDNGGGFLLVKYDSLSQLLKSVFPQHQWNFKNSQVRIWNDKELAKYYVEWLKNNSSPKELQYLKRITEERELQSEDVLVNILSQVSSNFGSSSKGSKKSQLMLKETLNLLFYGEEVLEEYKHPDIWTSTGPLELDFYYPQFNLAFEYQGQQHYRDIAKYNRSESLDENKQRDLTKEKLCKSKGITLIEVPYWWDRKFSSLYATIYNHRPDLLPKPISSQPIPLSPPAKQTSSSTDNRVKVMTAMEWEASMNPTGWWMTEKFDGVRLYWDGSQFYTRHGEKVFPPKSITSQLPSVPLDGELWTRYGLFQEAVNLCKSANEDKWKKAQFVVFDSPSLSDKPFEERIEHLKSLTLPSFVKVVDVVKCNGKEHLESYLSQIVSKGGEGVMLREPESLYKVGRSSSLRKFKLFLDTEVKVVKNQYPHGFLCQQINGKILFVNISPKDQSAELKKLGPGSIITVKHLGTNVHGTLQYPQFHRQRHDVSWENLIKN